MKEIFGTIPSSIKLYNHNFDILDDFLFLLSASSFKEIKNNSQKIHTNIFFTKPSTRKKLKMMNFLSLIVSDAPYSMKDNIFITRNSMILQFVFVL